MNRRMKSRPARRVPEDELVLAELIAAASSHGLVGCQGAVFRDRHGWRISNDLDGLDISQSNGVLSTPPPGATACCAIGAQALSVGVPKPIIDVCGNDALPDTELTELYRRGPRLRRHIRDWNIGAAFSQAMDPAMSVEGG